MNFSVSADCRVKIKESEKRDEYLDLAKKTVEHSDELISIVIAEFRIVPKGLKRRLEEL